MQIHAPVETLPVDHFDEHETDGAARNQPDRDTDAGGKRAFLRQHPGDLPSRQPEVAQHAEFASACRGERGKAGGDTGQADDHGDGFKKVGDGEGAVEDAQADGADLAGVG